MIGVLASGNGTNLQALLDAGLPISAVGSNRKDAYALVRARAAGIPVATFSLACHADRSERDLVLATWLEEHGVELVVLAGYMHLLTEPFLRRFPERIVNVHPSLLPSFPGAHAIDDALAAGVETTGVTVHLVDEGLDTGPVLAQEVVPVAPPGNAGRAHPRGRAPAPARGGERALSRRALISVYDKAGVDVFARGLVELGWELVSSGGTATFLAEEGLPVTTVEEVTMAPEMLGGRVKTLHPRIHAGILARRELDEDTQALEEQQIDLIDLVCVSLYPFASVATRPGATEREIVEMIDVGGPSMLRAAAKNFAHVTVVSGSAQYEGVLSELREHGDTTPETRKRLAREAFETTAAYEAAIANWFGEPEPFPEQLTIALRKVVRPLLRREPASGGGLLPRAGRSPASALGGQATRRQGALVQQPRRPRRGSPHRP